MSLSQVSTFDPLTDPDLLPNGGSDRVQVIWAVAKFLDLMLTLQIPDFQMYVSLCYVLPIARADT